MQNHRVAVYGTLKQGLSNHRLLRDSRFLGRQRLTAITLYDLGSYPGARLEKSLGIEVEVYQVSSATLKQLDALEDYWPDNPEQGLYNRVTLPTRFGLVWVYTYNHSVAGRPSVRLGSWQPTPKRV